MQEYFPGTLKDFDPILKYLEPNPNLPEHLLNISIQFAELAVYVVKSTPRNAERSVALRKLLEAKDAAVRAKLD